MQNPITIFVNLQTGEVHKTNILIGITKNQPVIIKHLSFCNCQNDSWKNMELDGTLIFNKEKKHLEVEPNWETLRTKIQ